MVRLRHVRFASAVLVLVVLAGMAMLPASYALARQESGEPVTLRVWDQFTENSDIADQIYAGFTATHPNVTIERETFTLEQLRTTASTALASGTGPDVIYHDVTPGREFYRSGLVLSLDEYAEEYGWRERFYPAGLRWTLVDDTLTGLGLEYEFVGVFYNKTRMDEAGLEIPETLEQTLEYCRQASEAGFIPYVAATGAGWPNYFYFTMPLHNTVGVQQMTDLLFGGQGTWDSPEVVSAIEVFYRQMRDAGCFPENPNAVDFDIGRDLLWAGDALAMPIGTWLIPDVAQFDPEHEYVMSPFPAIDGNPRVYTAGMGSAFFISSQSAHPDVAAEFLDYLFSTSDPDLGRASAVHPAGAGRHGGPGRAAAVPVRARDPDRGRLGRGGDGVGLQHRPPGAPGVQHDDGGRVPGGDGRRKDARAAGGRPATDLGKPRPVAGGPSRPATGAGRRRPAPWVAARQPGHPGPRRRIPPEASPWPIRCGNVGSCPASPGRGGSTGSPTSSCCRPSCCTRSSFSTPSSPPSR
jgi:ABC-type glycerol-3-phosphate transport system substrate-binding protein